MNLGGQSESRWSNLEHCHAEGVTTAQITVEFAPELRLFVTAAHRDGRSAVRIDSVSTLGHVVESQAQRVIQRRRNLSRPAGLSPERAFEAAAGAGVYEARDAYQRVGGPGAAADL
ncbi:hypothetical protein [Nocardia sp. NBC_00565]|uniref:hypothetical protein n=1 Tax=Nocardia sp. NBC_00565 TaxID=2975993 RepID=UPI003FA5BCA1